MYADAVPEESPFAPGLPPWWGGAAALHPSRRTPAPVERVAIEALGMPDVQHRADGGMRVRCGLEAREDADLVVEIAGERLLLHRGGSTRAVLLPAEIDPASRVLRISGLMVTVDLSRRVPPPPAWLRAARWVWAALQGLFRP